jgi:hypothetical protein
MKCRASPLLKARALWVPGWCVPAGGFVIQKNTFVEAQELRDFSR